MSLQDFLTKLPADQKELLLGRETDNPLGCAFSGKRTVHTGLGGSPLAPEQAQKAWQEVLGAATTEIAKQSLYLHIPFCETKCLYCGFFFRMRRNRKLKIII